MVEYSLDLVFHSLADPTRRDILRRVSKHELSVGELASPYHVTFAAISKHLKVLEKAALITKRKAGKQHFIAASPPALELAAEHLARYMKLWEDRFDRLDTILEQEKKKLKDQTKKHGKK
jgi:DNA-binding transcriptional ArsR family regulator